MSDVIRTSQLAFSTHDACRMLAISRTTLYKIAKLNDIKPVKFGTATRWRLTDLNRLLDDPASQTTTA